MSKQVMNKTVNLQHDISFRTLHYTSPERLCRPPYFLKGKAFLLLRHQDFNNQINAVIAPYYKNQITIGFSKFHSFFVSPLIKIEFEKEMPHITMYDGQKSVIGSLNQS